jgi:NAD(P)H-hydrate repair Nnr-like enzyme with NAD(P)H-hydrate epimerase domain
MSSGGGFAGLAALLAGAGLLIGGCGETVIDDAKTEAAIEQNLERSVGQRVSSVDCPSGVEVTTGKTFDCAVSLDGGGKETATLKILNEDADVEVTDLKPEKEAGGE